ncbi:reticulocalbin-3 isoform X1 [Ursus arctos]|uniref:reticulocalbin-3 isoform X1 n=1 Tax=Ursus arctos TaxID=9644 RepID=UPI002548270A|nr:reticulocalbin-3 isoform X1 [Ursus arctos]
MMWRPSLLLLLLLLRRGAQGKPSPDAGPHGQGRVHQAAPLSEAPHDDAHGNFQYDHEAFLGREVAKEFDQLSPEESRARLGRIVDRMDRAGDGDGWVSLAELRSWIAHTQQRHIRDSVSAAWNTYDTDRDGRVGWEELRNATYGHYAPGEEFHDVEDAETYKKMLARDERRFRVVDQDGDSMATREELTAFLHPEEFPHMRDIVIAETLEDLDKNKDGYVQVEEYIADLYSAEPGEEEPAWVQTEREQFRDFRDLNKDGRLDGSEVGHWVLPPAQDQPLVEANHLLHESDTDKVRPGGRCAHVAGPGPELPWGAVGPGTERGTERPREGVGEGEGQRPRVCWGGKLRFREESPRQGPLSPLLPSDPPSRMGV